MKVSIETGGRASDERRKLAAERKRVNAAKREYLATVRAEADREAYIEEKKARARARAEAEEWQKAQEKEALERLDNSLAFWGKIALLIFACTIVFTFIVMLIFK